MILATTTESIRGELTKRLEPGESLVGCAYGLRVPSKETSEKTLRNGLYVFGAIVLYFQRDKVYVGLTDRRLVVLGLTERYARVIEEFSVPRDAITGSEHERGTVYQELRVAAGPQSLRFLFIPSPMGVPGNGDEVLRMHAALAAPRAPGTSAPAARPAASLTPAVAPSTGARGCRRAAFVGAGVLGCLIAVFCVWGATDLMRAGRATDAARAAATANDLPLAETKFREAIDLAASTSKPGLLFELAVVQVARGDRSGAAQSVRRARELDPAFTPTADVAAKLGDVAK